MICSNASIKTWKNQKTLKKVDNVWLWKLFEKKCAKIQNDVKKQKKNETRQNLCVEISDVKKKNVCVNAFLTKKKSFVKMSSWRKKKMFVWKNSCQKKQKLMWKNSKWKKTKNLV